jgi:hypothetical protein
MAKEAVNTAQDMDLQQGLHFERRMFHSTFATVRISHFISSHSSHLLSPLTSSHLLSPPLIISSSHLHVSHSSPFHSLLSHLRFNYCFSFAARPKRRYDGIPREASCKLDPRINKLSQSCVVFFI